MASDDDKTNGGQAHDPTRLLNIAYENVTDLLAELDELKSSIKANGDPSATEAKRLLSNVTKSIQTVFDERSRLDDLAAKRKTGDFEGDELDFHELRAEIGRRLDKLRGARDAAELPDGSE